MSVRLNDEELVRRAACSVRSILFCTHKLRIVCVLILSVVKCTKPPFQNFSLAFLRADYFCFMRCISGNKCNEINSEYIRSIVTQVLTGFSSLYRLVIGRVTSSVLGMRFCFFFWILIQNTKELIKSYIFKQIHNYCQFELMSSNLCPHVTSRVIYKCIKFYKCIYKSILIYERLLDNELIHL